jgi:tetratricopeptide (TPR) repeat protein
LSIELAAATSVDQEVFAGRLSLFHSLALAGHWARAAALWKLIDPMGRAWSRMSYRPGNAEHIFASFMFWQGTLREEHLATAELLATEGRNRRTIRDICKLRGRWYLEQTDWRRAAASFSKAVSMSRSVGLVDEDCETGLALAKLQLDQLAEPRHAAERLARLRDPAHFNLAKIWTAIGDVARARHHAVAAYKKAWADGEPYVKRYDLTKATELLKQLDTPLPDLPQYDPTQHPPFTWEADVRNAIAKIKEEMQTRPS